MQNNRNIITIDGPSGVGKGTLVLLLGAYYRYVTLDTGSLYRAIALYIMTNFDPITVTPDQAVQIAKQLADSNEIFTYAKNPGIRAAAVAEYVPTISSIPTLREIVKQYQISFGNNPPNLPDGSPAHGAIIEGRNVGTGVFPNALCKIYIDATNQAKAERRHRERLASGIPSIFEEVLAELIRRDRADKERDAAAGKMCIPDDAFYIDTSYMGRGQVFDIAVKLIDDALAKNAN